MSAKNKFVPLIIPKSDNQKRYLLSLNNHKNELIIVSGPAGTGKTYFACQKAVELLKNKQVEKIVITRPIVSAEEDMGFLPGDVQQKMDPWILPMMDVFAEYYKKDELELLFKKGIITICPFSFMRGRTFKKSFIIADETQNTLPNQMKMLLSRIGKDSRMVVLGDPSQSDLKVPLNGFQDFCNIIEGRKLQGVDLVKLEGHDIERSEMAKLINSLYEDSPQKDYIVSAVCVKKYF